MDEYLNISTSQFTGDRTLFANVVNQGIDARLEAFTKSKFHSDETRLYCEFHHDEISILLRRLNEFAEAGDEEADRWADDIVDVHYGYEPYY